MEAIPRRITSILAAVTVITFGILLFSHNKADVDLWGNLGFVKVPAWSSGFHRVNTFSFTEPDHAWINHEWLSEYILFLVYKQGGGPLLLAFKTTLGLLLTAALNSVLRRKCRSGTVRLIFLMLVMSTIGYGFSTRPHLFTYAMTVILLYALEFKSRLMTVLMLPFAVIWVNLHGAFFTGILIMAFHAMGTALDMKLNPDKTYLRGDLKITAASILLFTLGSMINPFGSEIWSFVGSSAAKMRTYLSEWAPFHPANNLLDHTDFVALLALCITGLAFARPLQARWLPLGLLSIAAALLMRRNIPVFALLSVFIFAPNVDRLFGDRLESVIRQTPALIMILALSVFTAFSAVRLIHRNQLHPFQIEIDADKFPVGTMQYIKDNGIRGNILAFFDWAEYCIWELYPDSKVFLDGRYKSAYSTATIDTFFAFIYGYPGGKAAIDNYDTDMVLIHRGNPAFSLMKSQHEWTLVCMDSISALFLKSDVFHEHIAGNSGLPVFIRTQPCTVFR